jgi:putative phosphoesterase
MTKLLVLSDSHDSPEVIAAIVKMELPFDELIYCGDGIADLAAADLPKSFLITAVRGNIDRARGADGDDVIITESSGAQILVTHGDYYNVRESLAQLSGEGKRQNVNLVVFGHSHIPYHDAASVPMILNPGSVRNGSYATIVIREGVINCTLKSLA